MGNTGDWADERANIHDFAIVEQCLQYNECDVYAPFYENGKPIFGIEYKAISATKCEKAGAQHVQMKHCDGVPSRGICKKSGTFKPLKNCYSNPTWGSESDAESSGCADDACLSTGRYKRGRRVLPGLLQ